MTSHYLTLNFSKSNSDNFIDGYQAFHPKFTVLTNGNFAHVLENNRLPNELRPLFERLVDLKKKAWGKEGVDIDDTKLSQILDEIKKTNENVSDVSAKLDSDLPISDLSDYEPVPLIRSGNELMKQLVSFVKEVSFDQNARFTAIRVDSNYTNDVLNIEIKSRNNQLINKEDEKSLKSKLDNIHDDCLEEDPEFDLEEIHFYKENFDQSEQLNKIPSKDTSFSVWSIGRRHLYGPVTFDDSAKKPYYGEILEVLNSKDNIFPQATFLYPSDVPEKLVNKILNKILRKKIDELADMNEMSEFKAEELNQDFAKNRIIFVNPPSWWDAAELERNTKKEIAAYLNPAELERRKKRQIKQQIEHEISQTIREQLKIDV